MTNIFKFPTEEENCKCSTCELIEDFTGYVLNANSKDEVEEIIGGLVEIAMEIGYKDALHHGIQNNIRTLKQLEGECEGCCEDFCDDCCSECDCDEGCDC